MQLVTVAGATHAASQHCHTAKGKAEQQRVHHVHICLLAADLMGLLHFLSLIGLQVPGRRSGSEVRRNDRPEGWA